MAIIPIYVKETNNTIPAGAVYAAPNGVPGNAGTAASPKDLSSAYNATPANGTLVLSGTLDTPYRQSLTINKKINLVAKPGSAPVISGAVVVPTSDFTIESGNIYYKDNYVAPYSPLSNANSIHPDVPQAANLLQVFVDGVYFTQVATKAQLVDNSFFVGNGRLYVKGLIVGKQIELSSKSVGINVTSAAAAGTRISGITVTKFGLHGIIINTSQVVLHKVNSFYNAYRGVFPQSGSDIKFEDVGAYYNGCAGIQVGTATPNFKYLGGQLVGNNIAKFAGYWEAAALKLSGQFNGFPMIDYGDRYIQSVVVEGAGTHGIWLDGNVKGVRISRNLVSTCLAGIHVEVSDENFVVNNICFNNSYGVLVTNTKNTIVANNTLVLNSRSVVVKGGTRVNPTAEQRNAGIDWVPGNNKIYNNIHDRSKSSELMVELNTTVTSPVAISEMRNNAYNRDSATKPTNLLKWKKSGSTYELYDDLTQFRVDNPTYEQGSIGRTGVTTATAHPYFESGTYNPKVGSPVIGAGQAVSGTVAELLDVPTGTVVNIGANFSPTTIDPEPPVTDACDARIEDAVAPLRSRVNELNDDLVAAQARIAELEASPDQQTIITQLTVERDTALATIAGVKTRLTDTLTYIG